ncbi:hypothetical protein [Fervidicoccus fontis]|nr:hypothetical protein [Fervidicoccus fontis]
MSFPKLISPLSKTSFVPPPPHIARDGVVKSNIEVVLSLHSYTTLPYK